MELLAECIQLHFTITPNYFPKELFQFTFPPILYKSSGCSTHGFIRPFNFADLMGMVSDENEGFLL